MQQRSNPCLDLDAFIGRNPDVRSCDHPDCDGEGRHRAPRSPDRLRDYYWFCLEHVRQYNAAWNYFATMTEAEIDLYRRNDAGWHRPTWIISGSGKHGLSDINIHDPLDIFAHLENGSVRYGDPGPSGRGHKPISAEDRAALHQLGVDETATMTDIKKVYKALVKRLHPDANDGNRAGEDELKTISAAYRHLARAWPAPSRT